MLQLKPVNLGKSVRRSFASIDEVLPMPDLIEVQKNSYKWFLEEGLKEVFKDVSAITDYQGNLVLDFTGYRLGDEPKYTIEECKERDATYSKPLVVYASLLKRETGEIEEQEIFMGDFPQMTESGTFIINGAERVIVSQLVRSPGVYYSMARDKAGRELFSSTVIPNRGAWLEFENDSNGVFWVRIDKNRKLPITTFIRAVALATDIDMTDYFGESTMLLNTLDKDGIKLTEEALLEVYRKLKPGEPPTVETAKSHLNTLFFDPKRYDLSKVGRYKYNKKLALATRISGHELAQPVIDPSTGEIVAEPGEVLSRERATELENLGVNRVTIISREREVVVRTNGMVPLGAFVDFPVEDIKPEDRVSFSVLTEILNEHGDNEDMLKDVLAKRKDELMPKHIVVDDMLAAIGYMLNLSEGVGLLDDIDHLGNRRIRSVGELLQNQFRIGFSRMERVVRERMATQSQDSGQVTAHSLINIRPVVAAIKEFFGSSPLSQFMDQTNPLAELTHKRRLSALGPGGLSRDRAGFEVRDVHYSHYGRMCPIETPEGPNIGLISYLATFARINEYGFIEAPYRRVDKATGVVLDEVMYMTADIEDEYVVAQANEQLEEGKFARPLVAARHRDAVVEIEREKVDFMDISPKMVVSIATAMIPFLDNDDANRALMGSNMQRQAVPLLKTESPIVGTGMEYKAAMDSGVAVLARTSGTVKSVDANRIIIEDNLGSEHYHKLIKFLRSNQGTCINQRPIVEAGETVTEGQIIADGPATDNGEISLGKNMLIGFMMWEGYNFEDAVLINERLVKEDVFTSIHIEEYEIEARDTKLGPEEVTRDIPNVGEDVLKELDARGIIRIGAEVRAGDILVGKVTPKGETELNAEERLLRAIFGEKAREVRDTSLRVPHGEYGIIVDVKVFTRENNDELSPGVNMVVRCYIAQKRKIQVGDKMAGRHGNKGVVSRVLPQEDMPYLPGGQPLDIVLNPLGVPGRMNIGQVFEVHLGRAAKALNWKVMTPVFDGAKEHQIREALEMSGFSPDGKTILYDGRTGEPFDNPVTVGYMYFLKLHHLVDDKIHARSTGPYSLVTQQPLGGKAQFGGQRFGEMEVWALEAYGAAYTLQEILTVKSDDVVGRVKTFEAIVKGKNVPTPGIPESFKVLIKELQSLSLDVRVLDKSGDEIDLKQNFEDDDNMGLTPIADDVIEEMGVSHVEDSNIGDSYVVEDIPEPEGKDELAQILSEAIGASDMDDDVDDELDDIDDETDEDEGFADSDEEDMPQ